MRKILFTATGSPNDPGFEKVQIDDVFSYKDFMKQKGIEFFDGYVESCHGCHDLMSQYSRELQGIVEGRDRVVALLQGGLLFGLPSIQATQTTFPIISVPLDYVAYTAFTVPSGHAAIAGVGVEQVVEGDEFGTLQRTKVLRLAERILNLESDRVNVLTGNYNDADKKLRDKLASFGIRVNREFDSESLSLVYGYNEHDSMLHDNTFIWAEPNFNPKNWESIGVSEKRHHALLYNSAPNAQVYGAENLAIFGAKIISLQRPELVPKIKEIAEKKEQVILFVVFLIDFRERVKMGEERHDVYVSPFIGRYTSKEMQENFSDNTKFKSWRNLWVILAETEMELGVEGITPAMVNEMRQASTEPIDYDYAKKEEGKIRHDVMAHIHEFARHCPTAGGKIHAGATSMYVCDNTDLIQMRDGMFIVKRGLVNAIDNMAQISNETKGLACLAYTHLQPAQPTTMGKRFTLYIQDLLSDLDAIESIRFRALGSKGTTGTQESFLKLFKGDYEKVKELDRRVTEKMGLDEAWSVTGQTYTRKFDMQVLETLAGIGQSLSKFALELRLLSHNKCVDEPFEAAQIGSSAMAYKRNPMRSERLNSIARYLMGLPKMASDTASAQLFERTLDDSAIRRLYIPEAFLAADAVLILANNITDRKVDTSKGKRPLTFYPKVLARLLSEELPFMATEEIIMDAVRQGYDRQIVHEMIRRHSVEDIINMKEQGEPCKLFERLENDPNFPLSLDSYKDASRFTGAAEGQTEEYLRDVVKPRLALKKYEDLLGKAESKLSV